MSLSFQTLQGNKLKGSLYCLLHKIHIFHKQRLKKVMLTHFQ